MSEPFTIIDGELFDSIEVNAKAACIGGSSAVRQDRAGRARALHEDQIVGQCGEYAICKWFGDPDFYFQRRADINLNPLVGDGGEDYVGQIDVKTTLMRGGSRLRGFYHLAVRQRERHSGNRYVLALCDSSCPPITVWLMGWAHDSELAHVEVNGPLAGAFTMKAKDLRPMSSLEPVSMPIAA